MPAAKKKAPAKAQRTTHSSTSGKKLYAVRDSKGRFKDVQTYERAHRADLAKKSKEENAAAPTKAGAAKAGKPAAPKTRAVKPAKGI